MQQVEQFVGLTVRVEARPPDVHVLVDGELDECNITRVATVLERACDATAGDLVLDVDGLDFLGVAGAALLRRVDRRLALEGRHLVVERPSRAVVRALACIGATAASDPRTAHRTG